MSPIELVLLLLAILAIGSLVYKIYINYWIKKFEEIFIRKPKDISTQEVFYMLLTLRLLAETDPTFSRRGVEPERTFLDDHVLADHHNFELRAKAWTNYERALKSAKICRFI